MNPSPSRFTTPVAAIGSTRILTFICNASIGVLFSFFAYASWNSWLHSGEIRMLLLTIQESLIIGLVFTRHPSTLETRSLWDWMIAIVGTSTPLFLRPDGISVSPLASVGFALQLLGVALSCVAITSLWRSFGIVAALRTVRTTGLYRMVRHPLYATYLISYIGFLCAYPSVNNVLLVSLATASQYIRALAEERVLMHDPAYGAYMQRVPYRFIPFVF